jgi:Rrf2 family protein
MILSQTAEYALRAVVLLADRDSTAPARVGELAATLGIPQNYLSKTLNALARTGVLASTRGKGGGFRLARPAASVTLLEVIDPFDHFSTGRSCLMGKGECSDIDSCAAHATWKSVAAQVVGFFAKTTLADLQKDPKKRDILGAARARRPARR